jgi:hypothetical protein
MDRLEPLNSDMRVELRSGERSVTEYLLNGTQICAALQQMGGGAVPQPMRAHVRGARYRTDRIVHDSSNDSLIYPSTSRTQEQRRR